METGKFRSHFTVLVMVGLGFLTSGAMLKKEDPILKTQTNPIKYEDKMKEVEGGAPKGAPRPSFQYYWKRLFLVEFPFFKKDDPKRESTETTENIELTETWSEDETLRTTEDTNDDWWFEQWDKKDNNSFKK